MLLEVLCPSISMPVPGSGFQHSLQHLDGVRYQRYLWFVVEFSDAVVAGGTLPVLGQVGVQAGVDQLEQHEDAALFGVFVVIMTLSRPFLDPVVLGVRMLLGVRSIPWFLLRLSWHLPLCLISYQYLYVASCLPCLLA